MKLINNNSRSAIFDMSLHDLKVISAVLAETISKIDDWEYQTLIGFDKKDSKKLHESIEQLL